MLLSAWTNQSRYIEYQGCIFATPRKGQELPSSTGCVVPLWSDCPANTSDDKCAKFAPEHHPQNLRWASDSCAEALAVGRTWKSWTNLLGLKENTMKSQCFHQSAKGRRYFFRKWYFLKRFPTVRVCWDADCKVLCVTRSVAVCVLPRAEHSKLHAACPQRQKGTPGGVRCHPLGGT